MAIKYTVEIDSLRNFDFWSGAIQVADSINALDCADDCWDYLDGYLDMDDGSSALTETQINDFIWFEAWDILVSEGMADPED